MRITSLILASALLTSGCGILYKQPIYQGVLVDPAAVQQLAVGMSKQQVAGLLGSPSIADPFHAQRWDYVASQRLGRRGRTESKTFTVWFEGDAATRWDGDYFPEQDAQLAKNVSRQFGPNLKKDDKSKRKR